MSASSLKALPRRKWTRATCLTPCVSSCGRTFWTMPSTIPNSCMIVLLKCVLPDNIGCHRGHIGQHFAKPWREIGAVIEHLSHDRNEQSRRRSAVQFMRRAQQRARRDVMRERTRTNGWLNFFPDHFTQPAAHTRVNEHHCFKMADNLGQFRRKLIRDAHQQIRPIKVLHQFPCDMLPYRIVGAQRIAIANDEDHRFTSSTTSPSRATSWTCSGICPI